MTSIALIGNPNTGKSTVFNSLTGKRQEVGNWPGKTVEKKTGRCRYDRGWCNIVDLPGTYSLSAYSVEEIIARNFIVEEKPDVVVDIVDASNLERNLYLTMQLKELGANVVVALNMMDVAERRGFKIDIQKLSKLLGSPVIPLVANKRKGIKELKETILKAVGKKQKRLILDYGPDLEPKIKELEEHISKHAKKLAKKYTARWLAVKLIEGDSEVIKIIKKADWDIYTKELENFIKKAEGIYGENADIEIADKRYGYINGIIKKTVKRIAEARIRRSDLVDYIVTNQYLGIPIFLLLMFIMFNIVFLVAEPLVSIIENALGWFALTVDGSLATSPAWLRGLLVSGVIEGVGNVLVFIPNIALLFLAIAILEDSGYMARAAFVMERVMSKIGLHGKAFIPLILGFGCNVPAIMATRTLENEKDRTITILVNSLIPCSARMAVFVFLAGAFFEPKTAALVIWSLVVISLVVAMMMAYLFRRFILPGPKAPFVIELPPYHVPTFKGIIHHMWDRTSEFISKAGKYIFIVAVLVWFLAAYPEGVEYGGAESYIGQIGHTIEPLLAPLSFGWKGTVALLFGFLAKEVMISAFGVLYGAAGGDTLQSILAMEWTSLQAYVFMVFTLIYIPCIATVATIKQETRSWKWTGFAVAYSLVLAWVISFAVLQAGHLLGLG